MDFGLVIMMPQKEDKNEKEDFKFVCFVMYNNHLINIMYSKLV